MNGQQYNQETVPIWTEENRYLLKVSKLTHPKYYYEREVEFEGDNRRLRYFDIDDNRIEIIPKKKTKHLYASFQVRIPFFHVEAHSFMNGWNEKESEIKYIDTPELRIVKREIIKNKNPKDLIKAMERYFEANTLIVEKIEYLDWTPLQLRSYFRESGIKLIFESEL